MSEECAVQNPMIKYADEIGWRHIDRNTATGLRGGPEGMFFTDILKSQLIRLNADIVNEERANFIIRKLNLIKPSIEGNRDMFIWLHGEQSIYVDEEKRERNVKLIDFDNWENNIYHVTEEWNHKGAAFSNRADVMFLINGIPIAIAETKSSSKADGLTVGIDQIRRYHRETPEMLVSPQVFEVTQLFDFYYGATWSTSRKNLFNWKEVESGNYERKIKAFFDIKQFLKMLKDYIIFITKDDVLSKVILRQHQTRAVEKVIHRVLDPTKHRGLVWHTQGSGKTLTMITIASKLLRDIKDDDKPTVLMIIDRNELETQLFKNITGYGIKNLKVARNKNDLKDILASDYRGLVISMIHKFDEIPENINTRSNIIVLIDEAHRTTGGFLGNYLMAALPNATYIGFTGTPIDKLSKGKGTFKVFGVDDEKGYLDKYSILESIEDGTTVELNYALAPSGLLADKELLEKEFLQLAEAQGVSDVEELNAILDRAVNLKEMMKSSDRISKIAEYVAEHFVQNVEPMGFKAFLVGVDREACAMYKAELDKYLPTEYSKVVYSPGPSDTIEMKQLYLSSEEEKELRKNFVKKKELPKILIVTEKLLTGYDAPILYCMYLDKPMRDHVLLQTIARVNRPYEDDDGLTKPFGFILDFVGIFDRVEKALSFDSDIVGSVIKNIDVLKSLFFTLMKETAPKYLALMVTWDDKAQEQAVEFFDEKSVRTEFFKFFKQLDNIYNILSPDAELRPYIENMKMLSELYTVIRNYYSDNPYVDKELTNKTKMLLREHTVSYEIKAENKVHQLGVEELEAIKLKATSDKVKVLNLRKILNTVIRDNKDTEPYLISIGEQAQAFAALYDDRQKTTQEALDFYEAKIREYMERKKKQEEMNIDSNVFAIFMILTSYCEGITVDHAKCVDAEFRKCPDYSWNLDQERTLRKSLYMVLTPLVGSKCIEVANKLLGLKRI